MISPFSDEPHRVSMHFPKGMEFDRMEAGSGTTKATGAVPLDFKDTWGQFTTYHLSHKGVIHSG